jgi:hypothetical protein
MEKSPSWEANIHSASQEISVFIETEDSLPQFQHCHWKLSDVATNNKDIKFHIDSRLKRFTPQQQKIRKLCSKFEELLLFVTQADTDNTPHHLKCLTEHHKYMNYYNFL